MFRSVGYFGIPLPGVPFDDKSGVIPVVDHRVQGGNVEIGEYAAGWIMRGPTGVIGTNRSDAKGAATSILADRAILEARDVTPGRVFKLLDERGVTPVLMDGWNAIDAAEIARAAPEVMPASRSRRSRSCWRRLRATTPRYGAAAGNSVARSPFAAYRSRS